MKISEIESLLLRANSSKYLQKYIKTIEDLFDNYLILSLISYDVVNRDRLIEIVCNYILSKNRNKKDLAKKVLYKIINNSTEKVEDIEIINLLFNVYKKYVLKETNEVWRVSKYIKDLVLSKDQIQWLIDNSDKNELVLNRVIRYPYENVDLQKWAESKLNSKEINYKRFSEILGLALNGKSFLSYFNNKKISTQNLSWAIFYSKLENKGQYLKQLLERDFSCIHISKVALKILDFKIIEKQIVLIKKNTLTNASTL